MAIFKKALVTWTPKQTLIVKENTDERMGKLKL